MTQPSTSERPVRSALFVAASLLIALALVRFALGFVSLPEGFLRAANFVIGTIFLGVPLLAVALGSKHQWTAKLALGCVVLGLIIQFGCAFIDIRFFHRSGWPSGLMVAIGQIGMPIWCVGLGATVATMIKERNMLIPVSVFLVCYDIFLVLSPMGWTGKIARNAPQIIGAVAAQVPQLTVHAERGVVAAGQYAGPADFVFLAMFLIALYRFKMRADQTMRVVIPVLIAYMFVVQWTRVPLPALVPIGLCVMIVNWREFKLSKDELASTVVLAVVCVGVLVWIFRSNRKPPEPQAGPSPSLSDRANPELPNSPAPAH